MVVLTIDWTRTSILNNVFFTDVIVDEEGKTYACDQNIPHMAGGRGASRA